MKDFLYEISDLILGFVVVVVIGVLFFVNINSFFISTFNKNITKSIKDISVSATGETEQNSSTTVNQTTGQENEVQSNQDNTATTSANTTAGQDLTQTNQSTTGQDNSQTSTQQTTGQGTTTPSSSLVRNTFEENTKQPATQSTTPNTQPGTTQTSSPVNNNSGVNPDVKITIETGATSDEVIDILYENDLIESRQEVKEYLKKNGLEKSLKSGTFTLNKSMTIKEMIDTLKV